MRLVGMLHAKMRQRGPVVQSDIWRCRCVQVLACEALQLKCVTSCCCPVLGATEGLDVRMAKLKRIVGQGPVKGVSLMRT
jgi:hypothetical protein